MRKIESVTVTKLFGYEKNNYTVNFIEDSTVTFVYAFNGVGKTTLFRLIDAAIKQKLSVLDSINFETLTISFTNKEQLTVRKLYGKKFDEIKMCELKKDESKLYYFPIVYTLKTCDGDLLEGKFYFDKCYCDEIDDILSSSAENKSELKFLQRTIDGDYFSIKDFYLKPFIFGNNVGENEIAEFLKYYVESDLLFANKDYNRITRTLSLEKLIESGNPYATNFAPFFTSDEVTIQVKKAKELIYQKENQNIREIKYLKDLKELIYSQNELIKNNEILLRSYRGKKKQVEELNDKTRTLYEKLKKESEYIKKTFEEQKKSFIDGYYNDEDQFIAFPLPDKVSYIQEKLKYILKEERIPTAHEVIENYLSNKTNKERNKLKISLFEEIINSYNSLTDKKLAINGQTYELEIISDYDKTQSIPPEYLSSGEKNLLLLYFHLIFELPGTISDNATFIELLDEPEVSMHTDWLIRFAKCINHINKVLDRKENYQYIVSTHSPAISYGNVSLMVEMEKIEDE